MLTKLLNGLGKRYSTDGLERIFWTALEVLAGVLTAANTDVAPGGEDHETLLWTVFFALLKVAAAKLVGDKGTAAILPGEPDAGYQLDWPTPHTFRVLNPDGDLVVEGDLSDVLVEDEPDEGDL